MKTDMKKLFNQHENIRELIYKYNCDEKNKINSLNGDWGYPVAEKMTV